MPGKTSKEIKRHRREHAERLAVLPHRPIEPATSEVQPEIGRASCRERVYVLV